MAQDGGWKYSNSQRYVVSSEKKKPEIEKFLHKIIFEVYILREERPLS